MADLPAIRAAITATMESVPDIGVVHGHERFAADEKAFRDLYLFDGRIQGWNLRRVRTTRVTGDDGDSIDTRHVWRITGYRSLSDGAASEIAFDAAIEALRAAFDADLSLGGVVASIVTPEADGLQLVKSEPVMFAGVLCHQAVLELHTRLFD